MAMPGLRIAAAAGLGLAAGAAPLAVPAPDAARPPPTEAMLDASVSIRTIGHVRVDPVGDTVWDAGTGSGVLVSSSTCEVWTAHHVIADAAVVEVRPRGWTRRPGIPAEVVGSSERDDIAVLRLPSCDGLPAARLGDSARVRPGDPTYAVGNPLGQNPDSISRGIISHPARLATGVLPLLQTDAAINPGNSGGALFNERGEVIGINVALASNGGASNAGIGYAVPVNRAREVAARLTHGRPSWGDAGLDGLLATLSPEEAVLFGAPDAEGAAVVVETPEGGPASGRLRAHDVIYRVGSEPVRESFDVARIAGEHAPGETLPFAVVRAGERLTVAVTLADGWHPPERPRPEPYPGVLGMTLESWAGLEGEAGRFARPVITRIHNLGPAHRAGLASSQRNYAVDGGVMVRYLMDVKTVTGVVLDGEYHPVATPDDVERYAERALDRGSALLLEIELWARPEDEGPASPLERMATGYWRLEPARGPAGPATLASAGVPGDPGAEPGPDGRPGP